MARYDFAVEHNGRFLRIQVKCTKYKRGRSYKMPRNSQRRSLRRRPGRLHSRLRDRNRHLVHNPDRRLRRPNPRNALSPPRKLKVRPIQRSLAPTPQPITSRVWGRATHPLPLLITLTICYPKQSSHPTLKIVIQPLKLSSHPKELSSRAQPRDLLFPYVNKTASRHSQINVRQTDSAPPNFSPGGAADNSPGRSPGRKSGRSPG